MTMPLPAFEKIKLTIRNWALAVVERIVRFKRWTEKLFLPHEGRVKPEGSIALEALIERFPRYLRPPGDVHCGEGWYPIIWDLCTAIEALEHLGMPRVSPMQAEERLGGLSITARSSSFIVKELVRDAEDKAATVCEECGADGSLHLGHGFAKTLCSEHAKVRKRPRRRRRTSAEACQETPKLLFLDTEFTDLEYPQLISIALVADSGERFYAELADGWCREGCSLFVMQEVLPQLTGGEFFQERLYAARRLADWIEEFGGPVRVVTDAPGYDWVLMRDLIMEASPANPLDEPITFYPDSFPRLTPLLQKAHTKAFAEHPRHHALTDAEALRAAWEVMRQNLHPAVMEQYLRHY